MGSKIKRYALAALAALFVVGLAGEVVAQNVIKKQYPPICTDVQNLRTAVPAGFIPCDWYRCGTSASTPTYVTNTLGTPVIVQVKDYNSNLQLDISRLSDITASMPVTMRAAITASTLYLYDGTDFEPWTEYAINNDGVAVTSMAPRFAGFLYGYDRANGDWDRTDVAVQPAVLETAAHGLVVFNGNYVYDTGNSDFRRWVADAADSDAVSEDTLAPYTHGFSLFYDQGNGNWRRDTGDELSSDAVPTTTIAPYRGTFVHGYHVDDDTWEMLRLRDHADDMATSVHGLVTASVLYGYDGTTLDMLRVGASSELQVMDVATRPGEDAGNDWRKTKKEETAVPGFAETSGTEVDDTAGGDEGDVVYESTYVENVPNWCAVVKNAGGGSDDALVDAAVLVSPTGEDGEWESLTWTDCDTLASGEGTCSYCCSNCGHAYVKIEALCDTDEDTTVDAWITGNKN